MAEKADRSKMSDRVKQDLFRLMNAEYSTDSLVKLLGILDSLESNAANENLNEVEFVKYSREAQKIKQNFQYALQNRRFYQGDMNKMSKEDKIKSIATMLEGIGSEEVARYFMSISADLYIDQIKRYDKKNLRPDIGSAEFQFLILLNKYHGTVIRKLYIKEGMSDYNIRKYVEKYGLTEMDKGIYIYRNSPIDREFILVNKYTKSTISHETALYYHDLTDVIPYTVYVSFPKDYNLTQISKNDKSGIAFLEDIIYVNNNPIPEKEQAAALSDHLNPIRITSQERTIADILKPSSRTEEEVKVTALKRYLADPQVNVNRLRRIASKQGINKVLDDYLARYMKE